VLLVLAMSSVAVYGIMLAGWSSGSKYPLLGAVRASAQMVSYEAALGLSVVAVVLLSGSLSTHDIVAAQAGDGYEVFGGFGLPKWNIIATGLVPFVIFLIAGTAEANRPPFDLVEAEQELVGGFNTEYASIRFAFFYLAEFMNTVTLSAIIVTLFLGGPAGPVFAGPAWIWGVLWFVIKLFVFLFTFVWFRATLPRFRYDQLMNLGWKVLIPLSLAWLLLLAAINIGRDEDWNPAAVVAVSFGLLVLGWVAIGAALKVGQARHAEDEERDRVVV
jgi:NADH-quinone oxidoreductase subunit H